MATWYVCNDDACGRTNGGDTYAMKGPWAANTVYALKDLVVTTHAYAASAVPKRMVWECTTAGTSHATTEPVWPTNTSEGQTRTDGPDTLVWTSRLPNDPHYAHYYLDHLLLSGSSPVAAGEVIYVWNTHAQSTSDAAVSLEGFGWPNTSKIICTSSFSTPSLSTGATITNTGNFSITTKAIIAYGLSIVQSGSNSGQTISLENSKFEQCSFTLGTSSSTIIRTNTSSSTLIKCSLTFGNTSQYLRCSGFTIQGQQSTYLFNGTLPSVLLSLTGTGDTATITGVDFSNATSKTLVSGAASNSLYLLNCVLPGTFTIGQPGDNCRCDVVLVDCSSSDIHNEYYKSTAAGTCEEDTTVYRSGSTASVNGTTAISRKISTDADCKYTFPFYIEFLAYNTTIGSTVTASVYIAQNTGQTRVTESQCWLEIAAKTTSGSTIATISDDSNSTILTQSSSPQTTDGSTWTGLGVTPVPSSLSVSFIPQEIGLVRGRVYFAGASQTIYVDPVLYLT